MGEKTGATKWALWGIVFLVILSVLGLGYRVLSMRVEREVLVQSHQYREGMAERVAVLRATLAGIDATLATNLDDNTRAGIVAQRAAINAQLVAARR